MYLCIHSVRNGDEIMFVKEGGVDIGDVDQKAKRLLIPAMKNIATITTAMIADNLLTDINYKKTQMFIAEFILCIYRLYIELHFAYLEIVCVLSFKSIHVQIIQIVVFVNKRTHW